LNFCGWRLRIAFTIALFCSTLAQAQNATIVDIQVRGNAKVEAEAIVTIMETRKGDVLESTRLADDIRRLFELGYFSDIRVFERDQDGGVILIVEVAEKPSIIKIQFEGFEEIAETDLVSVRKLLRAWIVGDFRDFCFVEDC